MDGFKKALGMSDSITGSAEGSLSEREGMTTSVAILLRKGPRT